MTLPLELQLECGAPVIRVPVAEPRLVRVLHAEDDHLLQKTLALRVFKKLGVEYEQVSNGREALTAVAERGPFHIVVLDNQMPLMTGTAATRELRRMGFMGTIIGMTGDPPGAAEFREFEAAGLNLCTGKDTPGVWALTEKLCTIISEPKGDAVSLSLSSEGDAVRAVEANLGVSTPAAAPRAALSSPLGRPIDH
mmetsp:Transcript_22270/g.57204  ORF Transcript_22270/g.57204 Transcript_22270/m.57204 type:complete len:195 (-) Transcript_22270:69-653(-)